ncbi:MAG: outer membrane protein assembly factor BamD [Verrucomicrobiota bacterium]
MRMRKTAWVFLLCALIFSSVQAALVWRPGEGWVQEDSGEVLAASDSKAQMALAKKFEIDENWEAALKSYKILVRRWPLSSSAGEAQFKVGFMAEKAANFWEAYKAYNLVIKKYPGSQFFDLAIERKFSIGRLYLAGEPQKLWKIPLLPSMDKAVEIFQSVIDDAPYGEYAADSYFHIGLARQKQGKWSEAIQAYRTILDRYLNSSIADDAQYQIGYAWYKASSLPEYDQSAAQKSIEAFEDFAVKYPNSEKIIQAEEYMEELNGRQVQGAFNVAKFYETQKNYKAAYIYYNDVVQRSPESNEASEAKKRIAIIRPLVAEELNLPSLEEENTSEQVESERRILQERQERS